MPIEKALALVLRAVDFSESSLVVTLFTREFGKVRGMAKGGRRLKGPFDSSLDLLALCRIVFLRKSSEALDLLTESRLERCFRPAGRDLANLYAGFYVAELLDKLTDEADPHPRLFDAACDALKAFATPAANTAREVLRFELAALRLLGHLPSLEACVECGENVRPAPRTAFSLLGGGVLCNRCRPGKRQVVSLSSPALEALRQLADPQYERQPATPQQLALHKQAAGELRAVIGQYVTGLLGQRPRLHEWI